MIIFELQNFEIFEFDDFRSYCSIKPFVFNLESQTLIQSEKRIFLFVV